MLEIIRFLIDHPDVLHQLQEGTVSLLGANEEETKAILEVFFDVQDTAKVHYWE